MKYYIDENNQVFAYEDDTPEYGHFEEKEVIDDNGNIIIEKVYPDVTVKKGLIKITESEAKKIINKILDKKKNEVTFFITKRQLMLQLNKLSYYESVKNYINEDVNIELKIEFDYADVFDKNSTFIIAISKYLKLDNATIDNLFIQASKL